ncbi:MAG: biotin/lipoyl-containing protein, partial [Planctomycetia bacterium]|nr:biotin/lipoyl-containing protein [Planctomycetia bacterium]
MYDVTMPKLSDSMEVGRIIRWLVKEGDEVHEADVLAEVESDKAVMELECFCEGIVKEILHGDNAEVPVGQVIAYIDTGGAAGATEAEAPAIKQRQAPPAPRAKP